MMGYVKKLMNFLGIKREEKGEINSFIIGNICFVIIEFCSDDFIVFNSLIDEIIKYNFKWYWFRNYYELENYFEFICEIDSGYVFILIG